MTNKEYLTKTLSGLGVSDDDVDIILLKSGLNGSQEVDVKVADTAVYDRFSIVLKGTIQNVSEGGYSISWNMDAVKLYYNQLCSELGNKNILMLQPKIRNRSNYW